MAENDLSSIADLSDQDIAQLVVALADRSRRVQKVELSRRTVWIKRYGTEAGLIWRRLYLPFGRLMPMAFRVAPVKTPDEMIRQEIRRMERFREKGIDVPDVLYQAGATLVLSDVGQSMEMQLYLLRPDPQAFDDLLVFCAAELGRIHAAGLCHGRPYPRDMTLTNGRVGFLDFEEDPEAVMPLATAQARDLWILFFQLARRAQRGDETLQRALDVWKAQVPEAVWLELRQIIGMAARFLPLARLIGRVRMGSDLRRFIVATGYLEKAMGPDAKAPGEAGKK